MKKPFNELSPSAIDYYETCPAAFYFKRILRRPEPQNKWGKMGDVLHGFEETYYKTGQKPIINDLLPLSTETKMAHSFYGGLPHLPPPNLPGIRVESEFHYEFNGIHYSGFKDLWAPLSPTVTLLVDYKTTGKLTNAPSANKLSTSRQPIIYAWDDIRRGAEEVRLNWVYMVRGEQSAKPVRPVLHRNEVYSHMLEINESGKKIIKLLQAPPDVRTMETRGASQGCIMFQEPCPHLSVCHVTPSQRLGGIMSTSIPGSPASPLDALFAQMQPTQAPAPVMVPQFAPMPPQALAPAPQFSVPLASAQPMPAQSFAPPAPVAPTFAPTDINPPPPPAPTINPNASYFISWNGQTHTVTGAQIEGVLKAGGSFIGPASVAAPPPAPTAAVAAPAAPTAPGRAPGKRGRPKGTTNAAHTGMAPGAVSISDAPLDGFDLFLSRVRDAIDEYLG